MVSGSPALLSAQVLGSAQHLDWDLNGDGKTDVSCPADQPTLRFRPSLRAGAAHAAAVGGSVSVKAVGPGGASPVLSQTFEVAPPQPTRSNRIKDAVVKLVAAQPTPYMCGLARDLVPAKVEIREDRKDGKDRPCLVGTLQAGALTLGGCFKAIYRVADIPSAERGIVEGLASAIAAHSNGVKPGIQNTQQALGGFDGFVSVGGARHDQRRRAHTGPQRQPRRLHAGEQDRQLRRGAGRGRHRAREAARPLHTQHDAERQRHDPGGVVRAGVRPGRPRHAADGRQAAAEPHSGCDRPASRRRSPPTSSSRRSSTSAATPRPTRGSRSRSTPTGSSRSTNCTSICPR